MSCTTARRALHTSVTPLTLATALAAPALAQQTTPPSDRVAPVVITAARYAEAIDTSTRDISVLSGTDLRAAGITELAEALRLLPGVEIATYGPGATPSVFLRGANSNQTLILVDGQRIGSAFSGLAAVQHLDVEQIERVEVLRGPAASLYGADAVGGVIQIFTRRDRALVARAAVGDLRSQQFGVNVGLGDTANGVSITLAQHSSRGYSAIVNPADFSYNPDRDGYRFNHGRVSAAVAPAETIKLGLTAFETRGTAQYDGGAGYDDRVRSVFNGVNATAEMTLTPSWRVLLRAGSTQDQSTFDSAYPGRYRTTQDQIALQNHWQISGASSALAAVEWRRESVNATDALPVTVRHTTSAVLGGDWTQAALRLNASARLDHSDQYGNRGTVTVGAGYRLASDWRLTVNSGSSFKVPTFNDLYYPGYANPMLRPERGQNVDVALHWSRDGHRMSATAYRNDVRDLIQFVCDANYSCAPQNVTQARLTGLTLAGVTRLSGWQIDGSLDFADPRDTTADRQLPRRAKVHGALRLTGNAFGFAGGIEVLAAGQRHDDPANSRALAGYAVLSVHVSRQVWSGVRMGARVENATDREYQLAYGYATGGRRAWLTLAVER
ncbi:MAG: TonB-dependent receptor [Burkholderiales bacterium]|nr:TonB-dependent receptor [Burkholderiales bacterium]